MADRFFDSSGPPELILHIFRQCDSFHDASALSMTCRRMHNAWSANGFGARLVWKFWLRDFPAVREALVAVRAAQVVLDAEKRDELPPKAMDLEALSADKTLPTMSELNLVWDLICLAQVIESEVLTSECYSSPADMIERYREEAPEDPERMPEWRNGFWTAMFRTLIAAAALAGVYQEPFHSSEKGQEDHQQEWVRKFVVLQNITVVEEEKPLFGFLDDWLMANILSDAVARDAMAQRFGRNFGRATQCHEDCPLSAVEGLSHSDAHLVVWEVMKMFWMTQAILASIELESHDSIEDSILPKGRAPVVLFKDFTAVTIQGSRLTATPRMREQNGERIEGSKSLAMRFNDVFYDSEQSYYLHVGLELAPLEAKFFEYFFRRHFNLCFHSQFFEGHMDVVDLRSESFFYSTLALFACDDIDGRRCCYDGEVTFAGFLTGMESLEENNPRERQYSPYG